MSKHCYSQSNENSLSMGIKRWTWRLMHEARKFLYLQYTQQ
jgi:hypothetical protein